MKSSISRRKLQPGARGDGPGTGMRVREFDAPAAPK